MTERGERNVTSRRRGSDRQIGVDQADRLAHRFEAHRAHLRAVAYRMLGSLSEADDAVQEAWLRLSRADARGVDNLGGWLTRVVARICLDMLRSRRSRAEEPLDARLPEPILSAGNGSDPESEALLADSIGLALQVVLDTLTPAERLAFVLHDVFAVPFDEVGQIMGRSSDAVRQLASRGRRRVQRAGPVPDQDLARQREAVAAFLAAARDGDVESLIEVLDPDVVLRADTGARATTVVRGARAVAEGALLYSVRAPSAVHVLVNGAAGLVVVAQHRLLAVMAFTVRSGRICDICILTDPVRLARLDVSRLDLAGS
jgi:RNA polymerase sigma factor (sigma-70 family)